MSLDSLALQQSTLWPWLETRMRQVVQRYGYQEIRLPILDYPPGHGAEMQAEAVRLRPEGTLACLKSLPRPARRVRNLPTRCWYQGPMWAGARQFQQFGVEAFGEARPAIDAELLLICHELFQALGLQSSVRLALAVPPLASGVDREGRRRLSLLCQLLDELGLAYRLVPEMVGMQGYYTRLMFIWSVQEGASEQVLCRGGRYDALASQHYGAPLAASGFAFDFERVLQLAADCAVMVPDNPPELLLWLAPGADGMAATWFCHQLRRRLPNLHLRNQLGQRPEPVPEGTSWTICVRADQLLDVWSRSTGLQPALTSDAALALVSQQAGVV